MKLSIIGVGLSIKNFYSSREQYDDVLTYLHKEPPMTPHEIILVDNGSDDGTPEYYQEKWGKTVTILPLDKNYGFQVGNNRGFELATGDYIFLHNPDIKMREGDIDKMISYLQQHPDVALVAPKLVSPDGKIQDTYRKFYHPLDFLIKRLVFLHKYPYFKKRMTRLLMWDVDRTKVQEVDWIIGACVMMPRDKFVAVGGFDERYKLFLGDTDICRKFWEKGWKVVYNPDVCGEHGAKRVSGDGFFTVLFKRTAWMHFADMIRYFWKWRGKSK